MPEIQTAPVDLDSVAVLPLDFVDRMAAYDFARLLTLISETYFQSLWLNLAERSNSGHLFPDFYAPTDGERLWLQRVEIGTPNIVEVKGKLKHLILVGSLLTAALKLAHDYVEIRKTNAETQKINVETALKQLELSE